MIRRYDESQAPENARIGNVPQPGTSQEVSGPKYIEPTASPGSHGQVEKRLFQKLFPTVYSLWKVIRKPRPAAVPGVVLQQPPHHNQDHPVQAAQIQQAAVKQPDAPPSQTTEVPLRPSQQPEDQARQAPDPEQSSPSPKQSAKGQPKRAPSTRHQSPADSNLEGTTRVSDAVPQGRPVAATTLQPSADALAPSGTELVATTEKAREELKAVQGVRGKAAKVRANAQQALEEAEELQEEAEGIMLRLGIPSLRLWPSTPRR